MGQYDIYADDPQRAMAFYAAVFRWSFLRRRGSDSWWVSSGPITAPQIDGLLKKRIAGERGHLGALHVAAFDVVVERIRAHGGRLITPIRAGMRDERQLYAIDPEGNSFRLIEVIAAPILSLPIPMRLPASMLAVTA
ncbi:MAG TPA: VOC family protein [Candidatus Limnocylindrales bacterium]|nr:VOC family protein [Candidatus Limnocylindrales bacterium]